MKPCRHLHGKNKILWALISAVSGLTLVLFNLAIASRLSGLMIDVVQIILELSAFIILSFSLSHVFSGFIDKTTRRYRWAFIFPAAFSLGLTVITVLTGSRPWHTASLLLNIFACLVGSFVASNIEKGWSENNAPPTPQTEQEVLDLHCRYITGKAKPHFLKRLLDIILALISLVFSLPVWLLIAFLIWWEDPGPVIFIKNAVGLGGINFKQLKFRSMITNAEEDTGPILGYEDDERVLPFGKFIRKTALDEIPQLINILRGDMSYVGPRPQRTVLVHQYLQRIPEYAMRHQVRPGLAGLAQVVDAYDISPKEKLAWDLLYIEKASVWLDIKLVFSAFYLVFALRWLHTVHPEYKIRDLLGITKPHS